MTSMRVHEEKENNGKVSTIEVIAWNEIIDDQP